MRRLSRSMSRLYGLNQTIHLVFFNIACVYALQRNIDETIRFLNKWREVDTGATVEKINNDADFDSHPCRTGVSGVHRKLESNVAHASCSIGQTVPFISLLRSRIGATIRSKN